MNELGFCYASSKDGAPCVSVEIWVLVLPETPLEKMGSSMPYSFIYYTNTVPAEHPVRTRHRAKYGQAMVRQNRQGISLGAVYVYGERIIRVRHVLS